MRNCFNAFQSDWKSFYAYVHEKWIYKLQVYKIVAGKSKKKKKGRYILCTKYNVKKQGRNDNNLPRIFPRFLWQ